MPGLPFAQRDRPDLCFPLIRTASIPDLLCDRHDDATLRVIGAFTSINIHPPFVKREGRQLLSRGTI